MNYFWSKPKTGGDWFPVGLVSSFPDIEVDEYDLSHQRPCKESKDSPAPGCKVFHVPTDDSSKRSEISLVEDAETSLDGGSDLQHEVLVFRYKGKFHAMDHQCPHSTYPLSQGTLFDIEDFGVILSAGIICPKHGWSFDLFTGTADRAQYMLKLWQVEVRDVVGQKEENTDDGDVKDQEVWVRRKPRMG